MVCRPQSEAVKPWHPAEFLRGRGFMALEEKTPCALRAPPPTSVGEERRVGSGGGLSFLPVSGDFGCFEAGARMILV